MVEKNRASKTKSKQRLLKKIKIGIKTKQNKTKQNKTKQNEIKQSKTKQVKRRWSEWELSDITY